MAGDRPLIVGPEKLENPYPVVVKTEVINGFGRGSSSLGIPTANIPPAELKDLEPGVYYGFAKVQKIVGKKTEVINSNNRDIEFNYGSELENSDEQIFEMVMSVGWNPFFQNKEKSAEVHIIHKFKNNFYGANIGVVVAGFIRQEQSYDSLDDLIKDIHFDIEVAKHSLKRPSYDDLKKLI